MSGVYTIDIPNTAVTTQVDLAELVGHAARPYVILEIHLSQLTEVQDAQMEMLSILLKSGQTTSGSGGSAATPVNNEQPGGASAGLTAEVFNTTKATAGTIVQHDRWNWNILGPLDVVFTDENKKLMGAGRRLTLELATTPADSITIGGTIVVQEIGS